MTRGELVLVAFIFALIYVAGLLPKLIALLTGARRQGAEETTPPQGE